MAPGLEGLGTLAYIAAHNQIRAHGRAYRAYEADFAANQGGKVGITLNVNWGEPRDPTNPGDVEASETFLQFNMGWYGHAIFVDGKYPEVRFYLMLSSPCFPIICLRLFQNNI